MNPITQPRVTPPPESTDARPADLVAGYVRQRAAALQAAYHADVSAAVATLARLRRVTLPPTALDPDSWDVLEGIPGRLLGRSDELNRSEQAVIAALVLFASHQQSRRDAAMHSTAPTASLGRAVSLLKFRTGSSGVERHFRALIRANDLGPALQHLRGLVTMLRVERIPVDYGALARDLYHLQFPDRIQGVRTRWARDFHRSVNDTDNTTPTGEQA